MAQSVESINKQIEEVKERHSKEIEQLKERRKAALRQENKQNRSRRNHAMITAGGLVESLFDNKWTEIGYGKLAAYLKHHKDEIVAECRVENLSPKDADKRLRDWERRKRDQDAISKISTTQSNGRIDGTEQPSTLPQV